MKDFPEFVMLKSRKCPSCQEKLQGPSQTESVVRFVCSKEGCGYSVDVCWLGDPVSRTN